MIRAHHALSAQGVLLKGDIPILMNRDSVDVWLHPELFDQQHRAGAPPDMFSPEGQNWGFPVYAWEQHRREGFRWWRARLQRAAEFFDAIRIDHVLGFFRIWRIPAGETGGTLGHFDPAADLHKSTLVDDFGPERLRWLSVPHIPSSAIETIFGRSKHLAAGLFETVGDGEQLNFAARIRDERDLIAAAENEEQRAFLLERYRDRALLRTGTDTYAPAWYFRDSSAYASLETQERRALEDAVHAYYERSEEIWRTRGHELLRMIAESTEMIVCAEDLGVVPDCVPEVLGSLGILGLRVERWTRRWDEPGEPPIAPSDYPRLSVATSSVHDTTPLRGWWQESRSERLEPGPVDLTPPRCAAMIRRIAQGNSLICVVQIQDLLALTTDLRLPDPARERINVPGTEGSHNWSYRIPVTLPQLRSHPCLTRAVNEATARPDSQKEPRRCC
jgi:4-alpha-glucanotransferase